jgi:hypothetical protein
VLKVATAVFAGTSGERTAPSSADPPRLGVADDPRDGRKAPAQSALEAVDHAAPSRDGASPEAYATNKYKILQGPMNYSA